MNVFTPKPNGMPGLLNLAAKKISPAMARAALHLVTFFSLCGLKAGRLNYYLMVWWRGTGIGFFL